MGFHSQNFASKKLRPKQHSHPDSDCYQKRILFELSFAFVFECEATLSLVPWDDFSEWGSSNTDDCSVSQQSFITLQKNLQQAFRQIHIHFLFFVVHFGQRFRMQGN